VTVIKNTNGFIFGGFTSIPWSSLDIGYQKDNTAFLFSLTNPKNDPLTLKVKLPQNAVCHYSSYGPIFGAGRDLIVSSLSNTNRDSYMGFSSYEFPYRKSGYEGGIFILGGYDHFFQTVEIEVFQVV